MPAEREEFSKKFWTLRTAARMWGVDYRTARRWVFLHTDAGVMVRIWSARAASPQWRLCVRAGQEKYDNGFGSPAFRVSSWQRGMIRRRWQVKKQASRSGGRIIGRIF